MFDHLYTVAYKQSANTSLTPSFYNHYVCIAENEEEAVYKTKIAYPGTQIIGVRVSRHGLLAMESCKRSLPLSICKASDGFYIGTFDPQIGPVSRESEEYFPSLQAAQQALLSGNWTQRLQA